MTATDDAHSKMYLTFSMQWESAFNDAKFEDALEIGIKAYYTFRDKKDKKWSDASLNLVAVTIPSVLTGKDPMDMPKGGLQCSFCGKNTKNIVAGADVFICDGCADLCSDIFKKKKAESKD